MTDREHKCPRCGGYLPTVTVKKPVYQEMPTGGGGTPIDVLLRYEEVEEVADCVRCTGGY